MPTTRRTLIKHALIAGAAPMVAAAARRGLTQVTDGALVDRLRADLETHASFGLKFSCSPGDRATADWTARRLGELGYEIDVSDFDAPFWIERRAALAVGGREIEVFPQRPVAVTGPQGVRAALVIVGEDGVVGDVRGRIAVVVAPFARHAALFPTRGIGLTVTAAAEAGARAIVLVTTGPTGEVVALNSPADRPFVSVPLVILAPKLAAPVVEAARGGAVASLYVDGEAVQRPCSNVVAVRERGPRWIAMSTPRSGWFHCVAERGTGQAAFLEIARWLTAAFPEHSVFLMNTGAHEYFFAGSHHALAAAPPPDATLCWAHIGATLAARDAEQIDGNWVMLDRVDPNRSTMATDGARAAVIGGFAGLEGLEEPGVVRPQAGELSTFTDMGFQTAFACIGLHRWFHTMGDTLECVDASLLAPVVRAHEATIDRLVRSGA